MAPTKKAEMVDVQATGPIRHGTKDDGVTEYVAGDVFQVTVDQAVKMAASGSVVEPAKATRSGKGGKSEAQKAAEQKAADEATIAEANARAEAERKASADAEAAGKA